MLMGFGCCDCEETEWPESDCVLCSSNVMPKMTVTLTGISTGAGYSCTDCEDFNGEFDLNSTVFQDTLWGYYKCRRTLDLDTCSVNPTDTKLFGILYQAPPFGTECWLAVTIWFFPIPDDPEVEVYTWGLENLGTWPITCTPIEKVLSPYAWPIFPSCDISASTATIELYT